MGPGYRLVACNIAALATLLPLSLHAADIYRWVDEQGQTHLSDTVPDKYRNSATRVDPGPAELTSQQRTEAEPRAAQQKKRPGEEFRRPARETGDVPGITSPVPAAPPIRPAPRVTKSGADCDELVRRYRDSQSCYAPYRLANGAIRPEAFQLCGPAVADPSGECVQVNPD